MENKIIFHANIDDDPEDFTRLQNFAQTSVDHIVQDGITDQTKYTGFEVSKSAPTQIQVLPGRIFSSGKVYASSSAPWSKDFITQLPIAGKRIAAIVAWGSESDTDVRPRQFLINAETRQAEPQAVPLVRARIANINVQLGSEAPDPTPPIVDAGYTILCLVTLSPTGVETVSMQAHNKLASVQGHEDRIVDLEEFEETAGLQIKTLATDIAALKAGQTNNSVEAHTARSLQRLATLEAKNGISYDAVDSDANFFLHTDKSKLDDVLSHVRVHEGIRMPNAAEAISALQIFNPLDPFAKVKNGVLFPAYERESWLLSGTRSAEAQIASYSYTSFDMVLKSMSRQRIRYGAEFTVCMNSLWWRQGTLDASGRYTRAGETFELLSPLAHYVRLRQIWIDYYEEPYWDKVYTTITIPGAQIAETWLQGQNMWLDAVGIMFTRLAAEGSCHVAIAEVSQFGLPDLNNLIGATTLNRADMKLNEETVVPLQPCYLQAGKRYAVVLTTAADHWVATVPGEQFTQGTFFYVLDGAYSQGDALRDLWFKLYRCKFKSARATVTLTPLQLSGGILSLDILAGCVVPAGCNLSYEIQVGSDWYNILEADGYTLGQGGTIPPLLPLRAVFNGSVDCMPAINLIDSSVIASRPDTWARHISQTRTLPVESDQIRVLDRYEFFDPIYHTASCKLRIGADFGTEVNPSSTTTTIDPIDGSYERTYVFNLGAPVTQFRKDNSISTNTANKVFHVGWQKDYAL